MNLRIAGITKESVVDGPGLRLVVFVQGCPHKCVGCHNPQTHDPSDGKIIEVSEVLGYIEQAKLIKGVTFSGGEPFMQAESLAYLAGHIKKRGYDIVTYTGFTYEQLLAMAVKQQPVFELIRLTDILVDGPYRADMRDLRLAFRGSRNQRLIDVPKTISQGRIVIWEDKAARILA